MDPRAADDPLDIDLGLRLKVAIWFLAISSLIILALRVYCKFLRKRGLWWDDYILIASWVCSPRSPCSPYRCFPA